MIGAVVEFTNLNIEQVYRIPVQDFFIYLEYINETNRRKWLKQREELEKQKARMRRRR